MATAIQKVTEAFERLKTGEYQAPKGEGFKPPGRPDVQPHYSSPSRALTLPGWTRPTTNKAVVFGGANKVEVRDIGYPKLEWPDNGDPLPSGAIIRVLTSAICGSDLHLYRGRTPAGAGVVLGHEVTGLVVEIGQDCVYTRVGDLVSVPFTASCGRCANCRKGDSHVCRGTNAEAGQSGIYGYVLGGGWKGGQAEYMLVPFADFNLLRFPSEHRDLVQSKWLDLSMLADAFSTGYHGAYAAGVSTGKSCLVAGCGPIGLSAILSAKILGAGHVVACDINPDRLQLASNLGALTIDLRNIQTHKELQDKIHELTGCKELDCAVECVGYECSGIGKEVGKNVPNETLELCMHCAAPGATIGILGVYLSGDTKAPDTTTMAGTYKIPFGHTWIKAHTFTSGQAPVSRYNEDLMKAILFNNVSPAKAMNVRVVSLDDAPRAYDEFNKGVPYKFVIDPHNSIKQGRLVLPAEYVLYCESQQQQQDSSGMMKSKGPTTTTTGGTQLGAQQVPAATSFSSSLATDSERQQQQQQQHQSQQGLGLQAESGSAARGDTGDKVWPSESHQAQHQHQQRR